MKAMLLSGLLLLLAVSAANALPMCAPCTANAECVKPDGICECVDTRNLIQGAPPKVCMCQGFSLNVCQQENHVKAKAARAAQVAATGATVKATDVTPSPKCVTLPANVTRKVPCEEEGAPAASPSPSPSPSPAPANDTKAENTAAVAKVASTAAVGNPTP